jgi:predicted metal-dependent hydrolase
MQKSKFCKIKGIGFILLERSKRAKTINITVKPFRGIRVAVPMGVSFKRAVAFASSQSAWIRKHSTKTVALEKAHEKQLKFISEIDKTEARKMLSERLFKLAKLHAFTVNKVYIRNQKTRWGSCSAKNNISLNVKLSRLPQKLSDYIMLHELVHTRIKNHSKNFWQELDRIVNNAKALRSELKEYDYLLF